MTRAFIFAAILSVLCISVSSGQSLTEKIKHLEDPEETHKHYTELFKGLDIEGTLKAKLHSDNSIAVQAAWEEAMNSLPNRTNFIIPTDLNAVHKFVGFLEGRVNVAIPEWWANRIAPPVDPAMDPRKRKRQIKKYDIQLPPVYQDTAIDEVKASPGIQINWMGESLILNIGDAQIALPNEITDQLKPGNTRRINACFSDTHCYVLVHGIFGEPHSCRAVSRRTGKMEWESQLPGCFFMSGGGTSGPHESQVYIAQENGRIIVFGHAMTGFYAATMSAEDGSTLFRFSTGFSIR